MKRNRDKSKPVILTAEVVFLATIALLGPGRGSAFGQEGTSADPKPAAAPASQGKNAIPQDQNPTEAEAASEAKASGGERLSK